MSGVIDTSISIRIAQASDLSRIIKLRSQEPYLRFLSDEYIAEHISEFSIAWEDDTPVGCMRLFAIDNYPEVIELGSLIIIPEKRGNGVGSKLIHLAEETAELSGKNLVSVTDNIHLEKKYESRGWVLGTEMYPFRSAMSPGKRVWVKEM